ncbi:MAG: hypothetical protein ABI743_02635 [bacterium]
MSPDLAPAAILHLDPESATAYLEPVRDGAAIGDAFSEIGLTPAFQRLFGQQVAVQSVRKTAPDALTVTLRVSHPFSAAQRPDLAVFNLKCWVAIESPLTSVGGIDGVPGVLTNADGYSRMWRDTAVVPIATSVPTQPYVIVNEDPGSAPFDWHAPVGWNVFFPGESATVDLDFHVPITTASTFGLYFTADYGQSATAATRQTPQYQLPQFAGNSPWKIAVTPLSNGLLPGDPLSEATWRLDIWDWKHGLALGSEVSGVKVYVPDLLGPVPLTPVMTGNGREPAPLAGTITVANTNAVAGGRHWGLVETTDSALGTALRDDLVTPVPVSLYRTYQWFPVDVGPTGLLAVITRCQGDPLHVAIAETFDGSASQSGVAPIVDYEWDWDYDGSTFDVESTGSTVQYSWLADSTVTVGLRVRDSIGGTNIATTSVVVAGMPSWGSRETLTSDPQFMDLWSFSATVPAIALDSEGDVHLAYHTYGPIGDPDYELHHVTIPRCGETKSEVVYFSTLGAWASSHSLAITSDGTIHIAGGIYDPTRPVSDRWCMGYWRKEGGSWQAPELFPTPAELNNVGVWYFQNLAARPDGSLGFAMVRAIAGTIPDPPNGTPYPQDLIYFASRPISGTWSSPARIGEIDSLFSNSMGNSPELTLSSDNSEWLAAWMTLKQRYVQGTDVPNATDLQWTHGSSSFAPPALLYGGNSSYRQPVVRKAPDGSCWLAAQEGAGLQGTGIVVAKYAEGAWDPVPVVAFSGTQGTRFPFLNFNATGEAILVWNEAKLGGAVLAKRFDQSDPLSELLSFPSEMVSSGDASAFQVLPVVAPTAAGGWLAAWQTDRNTELSGWWEDIELTSYR